MALREAKKSSVFISSLELSSKLVFAAEGPDNWYKESRKACSSSENNLGKWALINEAINNEETDLFA